MSRSPRTLRTRASGRRWLDLAALLLLLLHLSGCSSWQTVSVEQGMRHSPPPGVDYGTLVHVKTFDRKSDKFRVTEITDEGLGGNSGFYRYENMASLKVDRSVQNEGQTLGVIIGILGVAALVALIANADSVAICSPPCENPDP